MAPPASLRYAAQGDAPAIADYHVRCWHIAYRGLIPDAAIDAMTVEETTARWTHYLSPEMTSSGFQTVVALHESQVIGHITVGTARGSDDQGEVLALYVDPDRQGTGIGALLLETGTRILRNQSLDKAVLWTLEGNDAAIGFYQSNGWTLDGTTKQDPSVLPDVFINEVRLSLDLTANESHIHANRGYWNDQAPSYVSAGERAWASEPSWGIFGITDADIGAFPEVRGRDVVELGCGTAYISAWCARDGARSVIGLDNSPEQLATAKRLQAEHELSFPLIWGDAEHVPLADESFDVAISEYGAAIWCDPHRWIAEAGRLLRPGGTLVFLANSLLSILTANDFEGESATNRLLRPQRGLHHLHWPDTDASEFHVSHGEMIRILRLNGFEVLDLIELYAPPGATTSYAFLDAEWASKWPHEEIWVALKT